MDKKRSIFGALLIAAAMTGCDEVSTSTPNFDPDRFRAFDYDPATDPTMFDGSPVQIGTVSSTGTDDKLFLKARDLSGGLLHWVDANWEWTSISMGMTTAQDYRTRIKRGQTPPRALAGSWASFLDTLQDRYFGTGEWRKL
jgi:hypothetical protein